MFSSLSSKTTELFCKILIKIRGKKPYPDFTKEPIALNIYDGEVIDSKDFGEHAFFQNITPVQAEREGWMKYERYQTIADLEYSRRYPYHKFSKQVRKDFPFADRLIYLYSKDGASEKTNDKYIRECCIKAKEAGKKIPKNINVLGIDKKSKRNFANNYFNSHLYSGEPVKNRLILARDYLGYWKNQLNFEDWQITTRLKDFDRTDYKQTADIEVDLKNKKAVLLISKKDTGKDINQAVLHELIHLMLWELDDYAEKRSTDKKEYFALLERVVKEMTERLLGERKSKER
jgi:hypothetical protein